jgi:uncharacterized membrane protein
MEITKLKIDPNYFIYFGLMVLVAAGFLFLILMPAPQGFYAFITVASLAGTGVSAYIWYTKKEGKQLVCPTGSDCNVVVNSRYSKFLGIKLEYLGVFYYAAIFLVYLALVFASQFFGDVSKMAILIFTAGAFLFSSYLLFVQAFLLRQWCIWCLLASMISMLIFVISLISLSSVVEFLGDIAVILNAVRSLGFILGMGAATSAVFLFFRFLSDFNIDESEMRALQAVSDIAWLGLWLALISQFAFFVADTQAALISPTFLMQTIALLVSGISAAILLIIFAPFLTSIPFKKQLVEKPSLLVRLRRPIFINGAISLVSWYFAFVMDFVPAYSIVVFIAIYVLVLSLAAVAAEIWKRKVSEGKFV